MKSLPSPLLVAIMGPTGSGKSSVAESVADRFDLQLINADAFMVYRGLDIGTNKPGQREKYELLDIIDPSDDFGVGEWITRVQSVLNRLWDQQRGALIVGGTGLYVRALFEEYSEMSHAPDPAIRQRLMQKEEDEGLESLVTELLQKDPNAKDRLDLQNPVRVRRALEKLYDTRPPIKVTLPDFHKQKFVLEMPVEQLDLALTERVDRMFEAGWIDEVKGLLLRDTDRNAPGLRAIGYDCIVDLVEGELDLDQAKLRIVTETRQYAKRQRTWLRSEPRTLKVQVGEVSRDACSSATVEIIDYLNSLRS